MRSFILFAFSMLLLAGCGSGQTGESKDKPIAIPAKKETKPPGDDWVPYRSGGKYGFATRDRKLVIPAEFDQVELFQEGLAAVKKDGYWGVIRPSGEFAIPPKFQNRFPLKFFRGLAYVDVGGNAGYIDTLGNFVIPPNYFSAPRAGRNYWPSVKFGNKFGLFDLQGKKLTGWDFDYIWEYHEGFAMFRVTPPGADRPVYGFVDQQGKQVIPPVYQNATPFKEGKAWVSQEGTQSCIDTMGKKVFQATFPYVTEFSEGLAGVSLSDPAWGYINSEGEVVINFGFQSTYPFVDGKARVMQRQKIGFINRKGELIHPCDFQDAGDFHEGLAWVMKEGKFGYMNEQWEMVIPFKYMGAQNFHNGIARVNDGKGRWVYIDLAGNEFFEE